MYIIFCRRGMWNIPRPATSGWDFLTDWGIDEEDRRATVEMTSIIVRRRAKTDFMLLLYVDSVTLRLLVNFEAKFCEKACEQNTTLACIQRFWWISGVNWLVVMSDDSTGKKTSTPGFSPYDSYVVAFRWKDTPQFIDWFRKKTIVLIGNPILSSRPASKANSRQAGRQAGRQSSRSSQEGKEDIALLSSVTSRHSVASEWV
jgi:hypothetical protein